MGIATRIAAWLALGLLVMPMAARASGVQATLDRDHVSLGDTVTLTLTSPGGAQASSPDLGVLNHDFQIQDRSTRSSFSVINGSVSATTTIQLVLQPRHSGTLHIPPLDIGGHRTRALDLVVTPPSPNTRGKPGDPVFLVLTVDTHTPYVGEQVALDLRLFYTRALTDGSLPDPSVDGADIRRLGKDQRYRTTRDGTHYFVVERHYALTPRHAGSVVIPPVMFRGEAVNQRSMGSFPGNVRAVGAQSASTTLNVRPRPKASPGGPWLPARQVALDLSGLPADGRIQVGEPITVSVQEGATGLAAGDLPKPMLPPLDGADVYPDQPQDVTRNNGQWVTGSRTRTFAIVPNRVGTLRIPPITLDWWNVVSDQPETARIPGHTLQVVPANGAAAPSATASVAPPSAATSALPSMPAVAASAPRPARAPDRADEASPWRAVALVSLALWLLSAVVVVIGWLRSRRGGGSATENHEASGDGSARTLRNAFLVAARGEDLAATERALLAWARIQRPGIEHLQGLSAQIGDERQREAIDELARARYAAKAPPDGVGHRLADALGAGLAWRKAAGPGADEGLAPLYPRR